MKNIKRICISIILISIALTMTVAAHSGNITGWKEKNSNKITKYNNEYYGYHKESGVIHYHKVKWDEQNKKWKIVDPDIYYNEKFQITKEAEDNERKEVTFEEAVDGDTAKFIMDGKKITVRFLAIDTPESVHPNKEVEPYGKEASDFTKERLSNATNIILEFDQKSDKQDKYGRYLAWIWVDGQLLQEELIKEGLAKTEYIYGEYKYLEQIQEEENNAKSKKIGIWKDEIQENLEDEKDQNIITNNTDKGNTIKNERYRVEIIIATIIMIAIAMILKKIQKKMKKSKSKSKK